VFTEEPIPADALKGMRILAFSGIARPASYESDLQDLGLDVVSVLRFRDHQAYGPAQVNRIRAAARSARADILVTPEKDQVRLGSDLFPIPLYALRMRLVAEDEEGLWSFISGRLFDPAVRSLGSRG
jgi:tetraacyldisaccharide 4'-kinase